jgi:hypothetical protein
VFAQKWSVTLEAGGAERPAPQEWLEQFFMRDFTGPGEFGETLVTGDGALEAGYDVEREAARAAFERWLRGRRAIGPETAVKVGEG